MFTTRSTVCSPWLLWKPPPRSPLVNQCRHLFRSKEEKKEKRKQLWDEAKKGYFGDFHEFRKNKGKLYQAPSHVLSKKESVRFPCIPVRSLTGEPCTFPDVTFGKTSLLLMSLRAFGMAACDEYRAHFASKFASISNVAVYELSVVEQAPYRLMSGMLYRNLKRHVPSNRHEHFLFYSGKFDEMRTSIGIHNSIVGYCFLLDDQGLIRWRAHASPTTQELDSLVKCTELLLKQSLKK